MSQIWVVAVALATAGWCWLASVQTASPVVTFASVAALAIAGGCAAGFVFSTYDEEAQSVGKVKDWILGALTGVAITEVVKGGHEIYGFFAQFKAKGANDNAVAVMIAMAVAEFIAGFFLMYFNRELHLNPLLHRSRQELKKLAAGAEPALKEADREVPVTAKADAAADNKRPGENWPSVEKLLEYVESNHITPDDVPSPALLTQIANAYYHAGEYERAAPFFRRALLISPQDADAGLKLAVALGGRGRAREAVHILRMLEERKLGIPAVYKLLGYYTLWMDDALDDAVKFGETYVKSVPDDGGGWFNLACAYAQRYGRDRRPEDREKALEILKEVVAMDKGWRQRAKELMQNDSFTSLAGDSEFQKIING